MLGKYSIEPAYPQLRGLGQTTTAEPRTNWSDIFAGIVTGLVNIEIGKTEAEIAAAEAARARAEAGAALTYQGAGVDQTKKMLMTIGIPVAIGVAALAIVFMMKKKK